MADDARREGDQLPGNVRQRARLAINELAEQPRPSRSKELTAPAGATLELRRVRLGNWRIIYAIDEAERSVAVVAIRRRPPYRYEDLDELMS